LQLQPGFHADRPIIANPSALLDSLPLEPKNTFGHDTHTLFTQNQTFQDTNPSTPLNRAHQAYQPLRQPIRKSETYMEEYLDYENRKKMHTSIRADKICQCPNRAARFNAVLSF
jgi:hypothetical protein